MLFDYYEPKGIKSQTEVKKNEVNKDKCFPGRLMILKSYGFEEKLSKELLIKHNGNLFKVLSEYHSIMKPKDFPFIPFGKKKYFK